MFVDNAFPEQAVIECSGGTSTNEAQAAVLQKVNGVPLLWHVLGGLKRNEITDILILTVQQGAEIEASCGDGSKWGLRLLCPRSGRPAGHRGPTARSRHQAEIGLLCRPRRCLSGGRLRIGWSDLRSGRTAYHHVGLAQRWPRGCGQRLCEQ